MFGEECTKIKYCASIPILMKNPVKQYYSLIGQLERMIPDLAARNNVYYDRHDIASQFSQILPDGLKGIIYGELLMRHARKGIVQATQNSESRLYTFKKIWLQEQHNDEGITPSYEWRTKEWSSHDFVDYLA